jgi:hypothetical protein
MNGRPVGVSEDFYSPVYTELADHSAVNQNRFEVITWQFLGALPVTEIEAPPAFPANDELLLKSFERTAIEPVRFNRTGNPVLSEW